MEAEASFPARLENYEAMKNFVLAEARRAGMAEKQLLRLLLGFEEAVLNVIYYAYEPEARGDIRLRTSVWDACFFLEIADQGKPFNPLLQDDKIEAECTLSLEERTIGGLGIPFIRRIFDKLSYSYVEEGAFPGNCLLLAMKLQSADSPKPAAEP